MTQQGAFALVVAGGEMVIRAKESPQGAAVPPEELLRLVPEDILPRIRTLDWSHQPGAHYSVRMTMDLVQILWKLVREGTNAIVVTCGADTIEEMAYLTDLLWAYPQPVIFTCATRPHDSRGSDGPLNLAQAFCAASSEKCWGLGVLLCAHDLLFSASEVCEVANQRRCAFAAPDRGPVGEIVERNLYMLRAAKRSKVLESVSTPARNVELIQATLGGGDIVLEGIALAKTKSLDGLLLSGFGNGDVPPSWLPHIRTVVREGIPVAVTSRCVGGRTRSCLSHEGSFSRLLEMGVLDAGGLTPLKARLKLAVGIGAGLQGKSLQDYLLDI
jgi:L-asparaginase